MKYALAYFSRTGTTGKEAQLLAKILNVTPVKIEPVKPYSDADINWHDDNCRANREQNDQSARPKIKPVNLPDCNVLFLGYSTWWGQEPRLIDTFLESADLKGKTIVPFTTSGMSGPERGGKQVKELAQGANVKLAERVNGYSSDQLRSWVKSLNLN